MGLDRFIIVIYFSESNNHQNVSMLQFDENAYREQIRKEEVAKIKREQFENKQKKREQEISRQYFQK